MKRVKLCQKKICYSSCSWIMQVKLSTQLSNIDDSSSLNTLVCENSERSSQHSSWSGWDSNKGGLRWSQEILWLILYLLNIQQVFTVNSDQTVPTHQKSHWPPSCLGWWCTWKKQGETNFGRKWKHKYKNNKTSTNIAKGTTGPRVECCSSMQTSVIPTKCQQDL